MVVMGEERRVWVRDKVSETVSSMSGRHMM